MKTTQTPRNLKDQEFDSSNSVVIPVGNVIDMDLDQRFKPYDVIFISNASGSDCTAITNWSRKDFVPKGNHATITRKTESLQIKNNGSVEVAIGEIQINYKHNSRLPSLVDGGLKVFGGLRLLA